MPVTPFGYYAVLPQNGLQRVKDTLNNPPRRVHLRIRAVCGVANPRHSDGYGCGLRLASHPDAQRPLTAQDYAGHPFDQMPEDTTCLTLVISPQDTLEAHLNHLAKKAVGETLASEQTLKDVQHARSLIGSSHKLYRGALAFYLRGRDEAELDQRGLQLANVMLNAGLQPVREADEVAPLNSYLRWLPCVYHPAQDKRQWYTQLMFAQHAANLSPVWGRSQGTGHPGITFFNRGGGPITFDPLNRLDRQMNAHLFLFGPTGSGKSATLNGNPPIFSALQK